VARPSGVVDVRFVPVGEKRTGRLEGGDGGQEEATCGDGGHGALHEVQLVCLRSLGEDLLRNQKAWERVLVEYGEVL